MADIVLDPNDSRYQERRQELTDDFATWLKNGGRSGRNVLEDVQETVSNVELFLDWVANYSDGSLSRIGVAELEEYLLHWCPAKLSAPSSIVPDLCASVDLLSEYLADTGRLRGGVAAADRISNWLTDHVVEIRGAMEDSTRFGMAKSMFFGSDPDALDEAAQAGSVEELERLVAAKVAEHNARPIEERRAATDQFFSNPLQELPFTYSPPPSDAVEESAAASPLLADIEVLRDYLSESGRPLTKNNNLKLADGKALVQLLDTDDVIDQVIGNQTFKTMSSRELAGVTAVVDTATAAGAVRVLRGRLVPVKRWAKLPARDRIQRCWDDAMEYGLLPAQRYYFRDMAEIDTIMEAGLAHWLMPLLPNGTAVGVEQITRQSHHIFTQQELVSGGYSSQKEILGRVDRDIELLLRTVERLGLITWEGWRMQPDNSVLYLERRSGGVITLTAIGRVIISSLAEQAGFRLRVRPSMDKLDAKQLLTMLSEDGGEPETVAREWQPGLTQRQRGTMIIEAMLHTDSPLPEGNAAIRLYGFALLRELGPGELADEVRRLLDTELAGHAATFLLNHNLGILEEVGPLLTIGPTVDTLAVFSDSSTDLLHHWQQAVEMAGDPYRLLDDIGHYAEPESALVLEALGNMLPDKRLAKGARKELFKLRGRMART